MASTDYRISKIFCLASLGRLCVWFLTFSPDGSASVLATIFMSGQKAQTQTTAMGKREGSEKWGAGGQVRGKGRLHGAVAFILSAINSCDNHRC